MADLTPVPTETNASRSSIALVFLLSGGILTLFALNQFAFGPLLEKSAGPRAAQMVYVVVRVAGLVGLAYGLASDSKNGAKRNRYQTLSTVIFVGFLDQVFLKGLWVKQDMLVHPEAWVGFEPSNASIFLTLAMGYLVFTPMILILAFFGMEATRFRRDWKAQA